MLADNQKDMAFKIRAYAQPDIEPPIYRQHYDHLQPQPNGTAAPRK